MSPTEDLYSDLCEASGVEIHDLGDLDDRHGSPLGDRPRNLTPVKEFMESLFCNWRNGHQNLKVQGSDTYWLPIYTAVPGSQFPQDTFVASFRLSLRGDNDARRISICWPFSIHINSLKKLIGNCQVEWVIEKVNRYKFSSCYVRYKLCLPQDPVRHNFLAGINFYSHSNIFRKNILIGWTEKFI